MIYLNKTIAFIRRSFSLKKKALLLLFTKVSHFYTNETSINVITNDFLLMSSYSNYHSKSSDRRLTHSLNKHPSFFQNCLCKIFWLFFFTRNYFYSFDISCYKLVLLEIKYMKNRFLHLVSFVLVFCYRYRTLYECNKNKSHLSLSIGLILVNHRINHQ